MTLKKLLNAIGNMAIQQKCCHYSACGTSIAGLNPLSIDDYPVLFSSPTGSHRVLENTTTYEITLYWIDRLLQDNTNDIDIFSTSIEQLKNIIIGIRELDEVVGVDYNYIIRNFTDTEAMNDRVAGAYATVEITVMNDTLCFIDDTNDD